VVIYIPVRLVPGNTVGCLFLSTPFYCFVWCEMYIVTQSATFYVGAFIHLLFRIQTMVSCISSSVVSFNYFHLQ